MTSYIQLVVMLIGTTIIGFLAGYYIAKIKYSQKNESFIKMRKKKVG